VWTAAVASSSQVLHRLPPSRRKRAHPSTRESTSDPKRDVRLCDFHSLRSG
jgi:hypothetical protein